MIRRTMNAALLNSIANHPEVRPWLLGGEGEIDLTIPFANPANVALEAVNGGFFLPKLDAGLYEVHSIFAPDHPPGEAIEAGRAGLRYMFTATDAVELVTKVPVDNKPALGLARNLGFREIEKHESGAGVGKPYSRYSLTLERWRALDEHLPALGEEFHRALEAAKEAAGSALVTHAHDLSHDRAVGATVAMVMAGNPMKAAHQYNRWALFAGYAPIKLLSASPVILDVVDAIVSLTADGRMEVLKCR